MINDQRQGNLFDGGTAATRERVGGSSTPDTAPGPDASATSAEVINALRHPRLDQTRTYLIAALERELDGTADACVRVFRHLHANAADASATDRLPREIRDILVLLRQATSHNGWSGQQRGHARTILATLLDAGVVPAAAAPLAALAAAEHHVHLPTEETWNTLAASARLAGPQEVAAAIWWGKAAGLHNDSTGSIMHLSVSGERDDHEMRVRLAATFRRAELTRDRRLLNRGLELLRARDVSPPWPCTFEDLQDLVVSLGSYDEKLKVLHFLRRHATKETIQSLIEAVDVEDSDHGCYLRRAFAAVSSDSAY